MHRTSTARLGASVVYALFGLLTFGDVCAAWDTVPAVAISIEPDDNPRLDSDAQKHSDTRTTLDGRLTAIAYNERGELRIEPRLDRQEYASSSNSDLENTDVFLSSRGRYTWLRSEGNFYLDSSRQSILTGELQKAEPLDPDAPTLPSLDTGQLVFLNQNVTRTILRPTFDRRLGDRTDLVFDTEYSTASYSGPTVVSRSNFTNRELSFGVQRKLNSNNLLLTRLYTEDYQADINDNKTRTNGVAATFTRQVSQTMSLSVNAGVARSEFEFFSGPGIVNNADTSLTTRISLRQRGSRTTLNFDVGREVDPNGSGFVVNRDSVLLSLSRTFKPRLSGNTGVRLDRTRAVGAVASSANRDYVRVEIGLDWSWTQRLSVSTGYAFTSQKFVNTIDSRVASNSVYFGIGYAGLSRRR